MPVEASFVESKIKKLDLKYRNAIKLRYFEGLKIREIAKVLNKPENTIKSWISRGEVKLKDKLNYQRCKLY